jgi:hypothetical protein
MEEIQEGWGSGLKTVRDASRGFLPSLSWAHSWEFLCPSQPLMAGSPDMPGPYKLHWSHLSRGLFYLRLIPSPVPAPGETKASTPCLGPAVDESPWG